MVIKSFTDEQLNFFKFSKLVFDEFSKALRQTFKHMWENVGPGSNWDDSEGVRDSFLTEEGGKTKVPTDKSYEEWDCTSLFRATIYARTFALPDSKGNLKTLSKLYVEPRGSMPDGRFHASVLSPVGDQAETFALAIDQLRLLRNSLSHLPSSEINQTLFDQYTELAKDAFKALGVATDSIDDVKSLPECHFPTEEVARLESENKLLKFQLKVKSSPESHSPIGEVARLEREIKLLKFQLKVKSSPEVQQRLERENKLLKGIVLFD